MFLLVGGAVRDKLLKLPVKERDWLVVGSTAEAMGEQGFKPVGKHFPVFLHPKTNEEYALARTERKTGTGYQGFTFYTAPDVSVEQDLFRRDLTINAIAQNPETGELIDPYGGQKDLEQRCLRHVSPHFSEDPLRVLRAARFLARFSALGFSISPKTLGLMRQISESGELETLSKERVWQETDKALQTETPSAFFQTLHDVGALQRLIPTIDTLLFGQQVTAQANLQALNDTSPKPDTRLRFAQLWYTARSHALDNEAQIKQVCTELKAPSAHCKLALKVALLQNQLYSVADDNSATTLDLLNKLDAWRQPELLDAFIAVYSNRQVSHSSDILMRAYSAALKVSISDLQQQGFKGAALGKAITDKRLALITSALSTGNSNTDG